MIKAGSARCVMFFDEIDKAGLKHGVNEIMNILIHLTDPNSNDKFNDKFFQEIKALKKKIPLLQGNLFFCKKYKPRMI